MQLTHKNYVEYQKRDKWYCEYASEIFLEEYLIGSLRLNVQDIPCIVTSISLDLLSLGQLVILRSGLIARIDKITYEQEEVYHSISIECVVGEDIGRTTFSLKVTPKRMLERQYVNCIELDTSDPTDE